MRWSDLDTLRHVNNVVYVEYALEVWPHLRTNGVIPHYDPNHVRVDYRLPVLKSDRPVHIESTVDGSVLTQEIFAGGAQHSAAIVTSTFDSEREQARIEAKAHNGELMLRYADLDDRRQINMAKHFELFQESRVLFMNTVLRDAGIKSIVIARADVHVIEPIRWRPTPVETQAWVKRVGGSSFEIRAQICQGDQVAAYADTVMVAFDPQTQKSSTLDEAQRNQLRALMID